jgi:hypothetical protein
MFLEQYWGAPTTYGQLRGHPGLRMRRLSQAMNAVRWDSVREPGRPRHSGSRPRRASRPARSGSPVGMGNHALPRPAWWGSGPPCAALIALKIKSAGLVGPMELAVRKQD